jgi:hypothetical protein
MKLLAILAIFAAAVQSEDKLFKILKYFSLI